jgi:lipid-binding SYLF domain-containing protein
MKRLYGPIALLSAAAVVSLSSYAIADDKSADLAEKLTSATAVYQELLTAPDRGVPKELLEKCKCIAVIPHTVKGAFVYGARHGNGVMSCRHADGAWSAPSFVTLTGGSVGPQIGIETSDLVVFFMNERGARSLMTGSKITLGGSASVAAGPFGRTGEASTDLKLNAEIYTYAKAKGLFAGVSIAGARLAANKDKNALFYGGPVTVSQLLFDGKSPAVPAGAEGFRKALP